MSVKFAILNSRQPLRPHGKAAWVKACVRAMNWIQEQGGTVITSVGNQTWELVTTLAAIDLVPCQIILPSDIDQLTHLTNKEIILQFGLKRELVEFAALDNTSCHSSMIARDHQIAGIANTLLPISISKTGTMSSLVDSNKSKVNFSFQTPYETNHEKLSYSINHDQLSQTILEFESERQDYLIHWTRTNNGSWPYELKHNYYHDIINSSVYPRSALDTLYRIVKSQRIISSGRHMPQNIPTISFSSLSPNDAIHLMRWRSRYHEMSFEPYGIGFKIESAHANNIFPVHYYNLGNKTDDVVPSWLQQSSGKISDWTKENEYRHKGDFSLKDIDRSDIVLFTRYESEATRISEETSLRVIPIQRQ